MKGCRVERTLTGQWDDWHWTWPIFRALKQTWSRVCQNYELQEICPKCWAANSQGSQIDGWPHHFQGELTHLKSQKLKGHCLDVQFTHLIPRQPHCSPTAAPQHLATEFQGLPVRGNLLWLVQLCAREPWLRVPEALSGDVGEPQGCLGVNRSRFFQQVLASD